MRRWMLVALCIAETYLTVAETLDALRPQAQPARVQLKSRQSIPGSRALTRRALSPGNAPLTDYFLGTDLQWYGNISVGTPPQNITVVFDTGSATLEFASTACGSSCGNQLMFDASASKSFVDGGETFELPFATGIGVTPVVGNNTVLTLRSASDTVVVGGLSAPNTSLFLITNQTETFNQDPFSGIQGMSSVAQGFFSGLVSQGLPSLFGIYLAPRNIGNAELTIGGIDQSKFSGNLTYASIVPKQNGSWNLFSSQIFVNGQSSSTLKSKKSMIFDSGTSNILLEEATAKAVYALISSDIQPNPNEKGTYGIPCDKVSSLPAVIDVTFTAQDNHEFNLTIPSSELSVGPFANNQSLCQTLINTFEDYNILGASLLKHYYSVWDVGNQRLGFNVTESNMTAPSAAIRIHSRYILTTTTAVVSTVALLHAL